MKSSKSTIVTVPEAMALLLYFHATSAPLVGVKVGRRIHIHKRDEGRRVLMGDGFTGTEYHCKGCGKYIETIPDVYLSS